jgi:hypothetical protein
MKYPLLRLVFSGIEIEDLKRAEEERERLRQIGACSYTPADNDGRVSCFHSARD